MQARSFPDLMQIKQLFGEREGGGGEKRKSECVGTCIMMHATLSSIDLLFDPCQARS